jgi:large subunit ribosomal protein L5
MNRLFEKYFKEVASTAQKDLNLGNIMEVPRIMKVSINSGIGPFRDNREAVESFVTELTALSAQKPFPRKVKKSEAGFKIKEGDVVGYAVTLRGNRMWAFLDKLINIALPRVRDFRGLSEEAFDRNGNYSLGIKEHVIFPEVNPNTTKGIRGLQVTIVFNSGDTEKNRYVLKGLGFPFKKDDK